MHQHFLWIPHFASLVYLCPENELHMLKALVWGYWSFFKRDKMIADAVGVLKMVDYVSQSPRPVAVPSDAVVN